MALCGRSANRFAALIRHCRQPKGLIAPTRAYTTVNAARASFAQSARISRGPKSIRFYSKPAVAGISSQEAPNSQSFLDSGAIAGARDLVDVKKVLVIGSGGLSIGQAGEFDYSGEYSSLEFSQTRH